MDKLLKLLTENVKWNCEDLARAMYMTPEEIQQKLNDYEKQGIICGYKVLLDYDKVDIDYVMAFIEIKVTPRATRGFDQIAKEIMRFPQVESVYLLSGGYDLSVVVTANTFKEVCIFVSNCLSQMDGVISTRTNFVLSKYLEHGVSHYDSEQDERGQ